jgi:general secretion pathway protein H
VKKPAGSHRTRASSGFTLLEIAVVIFIMGLMLTIVTPYIGGFRGAALKSETRKLAGRAAYLYDTASARKLVMQLTFDMDTNRYYVTALDPYANEPLFLPYKEPGATPVMLPAGVRIRDVTVEGIGTLARGTAHCLFYPEGYVDATIIHLRDDSGSVFTLRFAPLTGRVQIQQGDISPAIPVAAQR